MSGETLRGETVTDNTLEFIRKRRLEGPGPERIIVDLCSYKWTLFRETRGVYFSKRHCYEFHLKKKLPGRVVETKHKTHREGRGCEVSSRLKRTEGPKETQLSKQTKAQAYPERRSDLQGSERVKSH